MNICSSCPFWELEIPNLTSTPKGNQNHVYQNLRDAFQNHDPADHPALITPIAYFAYRSTQPMTLPEFHGLTYIQFIQWRTMAYANLEAKYAQEHPHADGTPQNGSRQVLACAKERPRL